MERVTFLVERTGERIPCLLNPEALEVRRSAGIVRRRGTGGVVIGNPRTDDPLVATGGGITDYELKLLFDVDLLESQSGPGAAAPAEPPATPVDGTFAALSEGDEVTATPTEPPAAEPPAPEPPPPPSIDVRSLTQPLWALAREWRAGRAAVLPFSAFD